VTISPEGGRVVGCLVEKQLTTPQQYPLTLNGLSSACNQTTNRHPVMLLDDRAIERALDELKALGLVRFVLPSHGKSVTRYRHVLDEAYGLDVQRVALLALLLLRGPQTGGELRARAERMAEFDSVGTVLHELEALAEQPGALVQLLARRPGQKEDRWQQLLATESDTPSPSSGTETVTAGGNRDSASSEVRLDALEAQFAELQNQVATLRDSVVALRRSLGDDDPRLDQERESDPSS
jgi:uncharacterized protein